MAVSHVPPTSGCQGTRIKDSWRKPKGGKIEGGVGESGARKIETSVPEQQ